MVSDKQIEAALRYLDGTTVENGYEKQLRDMVEEMLEAAERAAWEDISTAPRDGVSRSVQLIGRYPEGCGWSDIVGEAWWMPDVGRWRGWKHDFPPTHWRPLPAAPEASDAE